jgi:hypothetical protein
LGFADSAPGLLGNRVEGAFGLFVAEASSLCGELEIANTNPALCAKLFTSLRRLPSLGNSGLEALYLAAQGVHAQAGDTADRGYALVPVPEPGGLLLLGGGLLAIALLLRLYGKIWTADRT